MAPRNHIQLIGRVILLLGILISAGALVGAGLRLVTIGFFCFWLVVALPAILASFVFGAIIAVNRSLRIGSYRVGNLNEYVFLSLIFASGLIPGVWLTLPGRRPMPRWL